MDNVAMKSAGVATYIPASPADKTDPIASELTGNTEATGAEQGDFGAIETLLARLPQDVLDQFSDQQLDALRDAAKSLRWTAHPVDIRLSIPVLFKRFYIVVLGGAERRDKARRKSERRRRPVMKLGNILVLMGICACALYFAAFFIYSGYVSYAINFITGPF